MSPLIVCSFLASLSGPVPNGNGYPSPPPPVIVETRIVPIYIDRPIFLPDYSPYRFYPPPYFSPSGDVMQNFSRNILHDVNRGGFQNRHRFFEAGVRFGVSRAPGL
jgi:hypothetical protein